MLRDRDRDRGSWAAFKGDYTAPEILRKTLCVCVCFGERICGFSYPRSALLSHSYGMFSYILCNRNHVKCAQDFYSSS